MMGADAFQIGINAADAMAQSLLTNGQSWSDMLEACEACMSAVVFNVVCAASEDDALGDQTPDDMLLALLRTMANNIRTITEAALHEKMAASAVAAAQTMSRH